jgi:hypothetical protein
LSSQQQQPENREALDEYFITITMLTTSHFENKSEPIKPGHTSHAEYDRAGHDAGVISVGRKGMQLSNSTASFQHRYSLARHIWKILSAVPLST